VFGTGLEAAQELVSRGSIDELNGADVGAGRLAAQRLVSKPWYVLVLARQDSIADVLARYALPIGAAILLALVGVVLQERL
jgi:hypothetical protein